MVKVFLPDGLKPGKVKTRATDRSKLVQITGPKSMDIEWIEPSPDGAVGTRIVEPDGTVWTFAPQYRNDP